jgi:hypothetical protein
MLVLAAAGLKVPKEGNPRDYITDTPPEGARGFTLPDSPYYMRRVLEGDLVVVEDVADNAKKAKE